MYTRFFRWASDRLGDEGIICFVTGRKPFAKMAYDGFRAELSDEFSDIYVVDLGGDVVDNPKLSGTKHNVFGIKVGVAISFLVKKRKKEGVGATVRYARRPEEETAADKLAWLADKTLENLAMPPLLADARHIWLDRDKNDWSDLIPIVSKALKTRRRGASGAIFLEVYQWNTVKEGRLDIRKR